MPRLAWLDGRLVPLDRPQLSITDRGFQLGDGLFESLRARRGVLIEWPEHLERLRAGAAVLGISLVPGTVLERAIGDLLEAEGLAGRDDDQPPPADAQAPPVGAGLPRGPGDAAVRVTVSRGPLEGRGTLPPGWSASMPTVAVQAWPYAPPPAEHLVQGIHAITSRLRRDPSSPLAGVKSTSRADYVFARLEAERAGADDAVFLAIDGRLSESTSSNVFIVSGDRLVTPPLDAAILAGTTRTWLLADGAVHGLGLQPAEHDLWPGDLDAADEAFLCASVSGIVPLTSVDGRPVGPGLPGPRTLALRAARERWIDEMSREGVAVAGPSAAAG
jgi:branched-chain amino acid aminotransferase